MELLLAPEIGHPLKNFLERELFGFSDDSEFSYSLRSSLSSTLSISVSDGDTNMFLCESKSIFSAGIQKAP